jgi:hypothetical protein
MLRTGDSGCASYDGEAELRARERECGLCRNIDKNKVAIPD